GERLKAALKAGLFYAIWYPKQWLPFGSGVPADTHRRLAQHLRYASKTSRRLARRLFHAMALHGPKLEREQVLLGRFVDIGAELFAIIASCARAQSMLDRNGKSSEVVELVEYFCESARHKIDHLFRDLYNNADRDGYRLAQGVLE